MENFKIEDNCEDRLNMLLLNLRLLKTKKLLPDLQEAIMKKDKKAFTEIALRAGIDKDIIPILMNLAFDHKTMMIW